MADVNQVNILGRLTRDPELKYSQSGMAIAKVSVAVNHRYDDKKEVTFVDVTVFGKVAENTHKFLKKGKRAYFSGRLKLEQWQSSDGQKHSRLCVIADNVQFIDFADDNAGPTPKGSPGEPPF